MHETLFANHSAPPKSVVLGIPLRPYSIGHENELWRQENPLLTKDRAEFDALPVDVRVKKLIAAVDYCSQSHTEFLESQTILNSRPHWHEFSARRRKSAMNRVWQQWEQLIMKSDVDEAATLFRSYLIQGRGFPPAPSDMARRALGQVSEGESAGRSLGSPIIPRLLNYLSARPELIASFRILNPQFSLWDFPFGLATWLYFTQAELDGSISIENADEFEVAEKERQLLAEIEGENAESKAKKQGT